MTDPGQKTLLHYRLVEKIGEGGMGAVWKAVDTTLNRDVAVKLLPDVFSGDAERLGRFDREARTLASLNHPNIASIYGIHEAEGTRFLAMELIEGEDLSQRLSRGPLPRNEALGAALQIAQAMETAHESGVIHRDLKPANIKIGPTGTIKVLDFGLAKALSPDTTADGSSPSLSPTMTSGGTVAGMILGTASYMSPEQAKGRPVDRRADIWSFGVVLFEMLTGRRLFEGETISETLAAVMMREIEWGALPAETPGAVRRLLQRCLQRDPHSRLRDIGDARIAIEEALQAPEDPVTVTPGASRPSPWRALLPWLVAAASLAGLILMALTAGTAPTEPLPVMRFSLTIPEDRAFVPAPVPAIAISPDSTRMAFLGEGPNENMLYFRPIHQQEAIPLNGTEGADIPFFSPDGQWIGFAQNGMLKKISVHGGPPSTLCAAPRLRGASWGDDGHIVFSPDRAEGLMRVSEAGGTPEPLTTLDVQTSTISAPSHRWPEVLPGGRAVLFTSTENNSSYEEAEIAALSRDDGVMKTIVKGGTFPRYVPSGFLVFLRDDTLFAGRFDPDSLELKGAAVPVLEGLTYSRFFGSTQLSFSENGTLVYMEGTGTDNEENLLWIDLEGNETPASAHARLYDDLALSPDGRQVALEIPGEDASDIWILELERDTLTRLTFDPLLDQSPVWSPDGEWIIFSSLRNEDSLNLYRKRANGTGDVERLTTSDMLQYAESWSPDGRTVAIRQTGGISNDISLLRLDPEPTVEMFLGTPFSEGQPAISPDGRWLAYTSNESDSFEVYVRPLSGPGGQVKISTDGGTRPRWGPDTGVIYYRSRDRKLMAVDYSVDGDALRPKLPRPLFDYRERYDNVWTISPDGTRILTTKDVEGPDSGPTNPTIVVNWFAELADKVPE